MLNILRNSRGEILNLLFADSDQRLYLRELAKKLNKSAGEIQGSLEYLFKEGILEDERVGNLRFFKINKNYLLYEEIKKIVSKTIGVEAKIKSLVEELPNVEAAFIFGSIAKGKENIYSDIDLMLIGQVNENGLIKKVSPLETELGREINYHIYSNEEIKKFLQEKNSFLLDIFSGPKIILKGNLNG